MRLAYVTRVEVPSRAAQSVQIESMARAFHGELGDRFCLYCGGEPTGREPFRRHRLPLGGSRKLRHLSACLAGLLCVLRDREVLIFTRDIAVALVAVLAGGRSVYEAHKEPRSAFAVKALRVLARSGSFKMVAISDALAQWYGRRYGIGRDRVLVAHSGVWPEEYRKLRKGPKEALKRSLGIPEWMLLVVHTGSLYKGGAELFGHVATRGGASVRFVHVGGTREECSRWSAYYAQRGVDNIVFIPHRSLEEVRACQCGADLLFYVSTRNSPIWWCTSPLKLFEYMASGTPILAACIGSVSEVLDESSAYCFDPERPETIISAFDRFLTDGGASARASRALSMAEQSYSWAQRARSVIRFCRVTPSSLKQEIPS